MNELDVKQRHGCLTAWLILMIVANTISPMITLSMTDQIRRMYPNYPTWAPIAMIIVGLVNVACAVGLFLWKKWGFFGFIGSAIVAFAINMISGLGIGQSLMGLVGIAILYGVLQIGGEKSGWRQLD